MAAPLSPRQASSLCVALGPLLRPAHVFLLFDPDFLVSALSPYLKKQPSTDDFLMSIVQSLFVMTYQISIKSTPFKQSLPLVYNFAPY